MNEYAQQVFELRKQQAPWESEFLQSVEELFAISSSQKRTFRTLQISTQSLLTLPLKKRARKLQSFD